MTTPDELDTVVNSYLSDVERALTGVPGIRRIELLADLRDHIAAERATLDPQTGAGIRAILDRLGDPDTLAAEVRLDVTPLSPTAEAGPPSAAPRPALTAGAPLWPAPEPSAPPVRPARRMGPLGWILIAFATIVVVCLLIPALGLLALAHVEPVDTHSGPDPVTSNSTAAPTLSPTPVTSMRGDR